MCLQAKLKYEFSSQILLFYYLMLLTHSCFFQCPLRGNLKRVFLTLNLFSVCEAEEEFPGSHKGQCYSSLPDTGIPSLYPVSPRAVFLTK